MGLIISILNLLDFSGIWALELISKSHYKGLDNQYVIVMLHISKDEFPKNSICPYGLKDLSIACLKLDSLSNVSNWNLKWRCIFFFEVTVVSKLNVRFDFKHLFRASLRIVLQSIEFWINFIYTVETSKTEVWLFEFLISWIFREDRIFFSL